MFYKYDTFRDPILHIDVGLELFVKQIIRTPSERRVDMHSILLYGIKYLLSRTVYLRYFMVYRLTPSDAAEIYYIFIFNNINIYLKWVMGKS